VVREVADDLAKPTPANRLIQGDVGSGKTAVALHAMLLAVAAGHQSALMAPTELLAEQHAGAIGAMLRAGGSRVRLGLLTGSLAGEARRALLEDLARGRVDVLVGTHALLTESVRFRSLAVAVIDEQHRFGVHQRAGLRGKGAPGDAAADPRQPVPHTLVMTATPIPRTLAMTLLGDLDVSTIRQLPPGRKPVATRVLPATRRDEVYRFVRGRIDKGEQAFVVAPMIGDGGEETDNPPELWEPTGPADPPAEARGSLGVAPALGPSPGAGGARPRAVLELHAQLAAGPLAGTRLGVMHGRLPPPARERVMAEFRAGRLDALVCTTIVEVGVDVPNATVMVIEDAARFGLAQLHQLRGRVGRGSKPAACILVGPPEPLVPPAKGSPPDPARQRLAVMAKTTDGFKLAEADLELRGFGDVIGVRQSGMPPFKVADPGKDLDLLVMAKRDAAGIIEADPTLAGPASALLLRRLLKAHGRWLGLGDTA
jgi:ATP-dependent DNA helicase RecG